MRSLVWVPACLLLSLQSLAEALQPGRIGTSEIANVPEIGRHHRVLVIEKNENPQNLVLMYTKLDQQCRFMRDEKKGDQPLIDFYWLNDRTKYHKMNGLLKNGVKKRLELISSIESPLKVVTHTNTSATTESQSSFAIRVKNLKEIRHDLVDPVMHVIARPSQSGCEVSTHMKVGSSKKNAKDVKITSISAVGKKTFLPPFRKVVSVTLHGRNLETGEKVERTFVAHK